MGFAISWIAVRGRTPEGIRQELGLREKSDAPTEEALITGCQLPTGWYLIFIDSLVSPSDDLLKGLSQSCEVVWCAVEEHVMFSMAAKWHNGGLVWSVSHDSSRGIEHLDVQGNLTSSQRETCDALKEKQEQEGGPGAEVDHVFDAPLSLARSETGYQHDLVPEKEPVVVVLEADGRATEFQKLFKRPAGCLSAMVLLPWIVSM